MDETPQLENGYTRIANEILESIYGTNFNATQLKIILCIIRYTYGFQRKSHVLSISFLSKATGISKRYTSNELQKLINSKVILVVKDYTATKSRELKFNKNYSEWIGYRTIVQQVNNTSTDEEQDTTTDEQYFNTQMNNTSPQQVNNTSSKKENIKDIYKDNIKENIIVLSPLEDEFLKILATVDNYPLDREKDLDMIKRLEERYPELDLVEAIKDWATYKLDKPLKKKDNPRSQINTSCKNYVKWGRNLKVVEKGDSTRKDDDNPYGHLPVYR